MTKHTILFLAANPLSTDRLALDEEARAIHEELERSGRRNQFEFITRWAVRPLDLLRTLRKLKPTIVHFSGHGARSEPGLDESPSRNVVSDVAEVQQHALFFQGANGRSQLVTTAALEQTIGAAGSSVRLVVLAACYSEAQADMLLAHVDCVVGMRGSIRDDAARAFAVGFYGGLGEDQSVEAAYRQGRAAISLEGLPDSDKPLLRVRDGCDANRIVLAEVDPEPRPEPILRHYLYIDHIAISRLGQQLYSSSSRNKKVTSDHEMIERICGGLRKVNQLLDERPRKDSSHDFRRAFVLETTNAIKLLIPKQLVESTAGVNKNLVVWVADPPSLSGNSINDYSESYEHIEGAFLYLTEERLDDHNPHGTISGHSALQMIVNAAANVPLMARTRKRWFEDFRHPLKKLIEIGGVTTGEIRRIQSLYRIRYMSDEQFYTLESRRIRGYDLLGYPLFVAVPLEH